MNKYKENKDSSIYKNISSDSDFDIDGNNKNMNDLNSVITYLFKKENGDFINKKIF